MEDFNNPWRKRQCQTEFPSYEQMLKAWNYFWNNNRLGRDKNGRVYRTKTPRVMPNKNFDFKNKGGKEDG